MTDTSLVTFEEIQLQSAHIKNYVDNKVGTSGGVVAKVPTATAGNFAVFDSDGGIFDSGFSVATDAEVEEYLNRIFPNT